VLNCCVTETKDAPLASRIWRSCGRANGRAQSPSLSLMDCACDDCRVRRRRCGCGAYWSAPRVAAQSGGPVQALSRPAGCFPVRRPNGRRRLSFCCSMLSAILLVALISLDHPSFVRQRFRIPSPGCPCLCGVPVASRSSAIRPASVRVLHDFLAAELAASSRVATQCPFPEARK
jgi:hypothetical protein